MTRRTRAKTTENLGERIKALRDELVINQKDLAVRANMGVSHLNRIEQGSQTISLKTAEKLANGLGVSMSRLFDFDVKVTGAPATATLYRINALLRDQDENALRGIEKVIRGVLEVAKSVKVEEKGTT